MSTRGCYDSDCFVVSVIRVILLISAMVIISICLGGCSNRDGTVPGGAVLPPRDLTVGNREISPDGSQARTRNQLPQGGYDEKSDCAPSKPTGWFQ